MPLATIVLHSENPGNLMTSRPVSPLIAIVGCDGSGKSTMTEVVQVWLTEFQPTVICHLGKQSGNMGRSLARLPLLGSRLERSIRTKAQSAQTTAGPDLATAIGIYAFAVRRARRFRRMIRLRHSGKAIVADRFPQIEVPGPMDGPGLGNARSTGAIGWLARRERRKFASMVAYKPDLVIRLTVSLDVACARKPDHPRASLARKISDLSRLTFPGVKVVEIDADAPLPSVHGEAKIAIARLLQAKYGIVVPLAAAF